MTTVRGAVALAAAATLSALVAGCSSSGPAEIASGDYRAFAASAEVGEIPDVSLTIADGTYTFTPTTGSAVTATSTEGTAEFVVCPPSTRGVPAPLGPALALGATTLEQPAAIGDCGQTSPTRITVVDLASASTGGAPMPFTRWIEFCDTSDPDC